MENLMPLPMDSLVTFDLPGTTFAAPEVCQHRVGVSQIWWLSVKNIYSGNPLCSCCNSHVSRPEASCHFPHTAEETSLQTSTLRSKVLWWGTVISLRSLNVNKQPAVSAAESKQHSARWQGEAGRAVRCGEDSVPCCVPTCHSATHNALGLLVPAARHAVFCHYPTCVPAQGCSHTLDDERLCD